MTLEQALSRSIAARLKLVSGLSAIRVVPANDDSEQAVPRIAIDVTRHGVAIPGHAVWNCKVEIEVVANAFSQSNSAGISGNQNIETLFGLVEGSMTGDVTTLSDANAWVYGAVYDGSVTDLRDKNVIRRRWDLTLYAAPKA